MEGLGKLCIRDEPGGAVIAVKVVPGASRDRIVGVLGDALKIAVAAPPEKGKANAAVAKMLAKALGIDRRDVTLVSGRTSPRKEFRVQTVNSASVLAHLAELPQ